MADRIDNKIFDEMEYATADRTAVDLSGRTPEKGMGGIHTALAGAGMIPGIGNVADLLDATLYGLEGDKYGAGLSLVSAIPALGLIAGGLKVKKGEKFKKVLDKQADMVEKAQSVVKAYGGDPLDAKLVSDITDMTYKAAKNLVGASKQMDLLIDKGLNVEDAMSVMAYYDSRARKGVKAAKDLEKMGLSDVDIWGKEAAKEMATRIKRGAELALEDAISGKYRFDKIFKNVDL